MITVAQLLAMPVGERIGGGFVLTVKTTKKYVCLPDGTPLYTVVLFDNTGELLADFKGSKGSYSPLIKGQQVIIIVAQVQAADPDSRLKALQAGKKLYVEQFDRPAGKSEPDYYQGGDNIPDWETITRGKIRHGEICNLIVGLLSKPDISLDDMFAMIKSHRPQIEELVSYVFTGEHQ